MILRLEAKKCRRTGFLPAVLLAACAASAFPILNMLVRAETFTAMAGAPFDILTDANWQMMAMLNILLAVCGACMLYHTEFADNGMQKMDVLPVRVGNLFLGKFVLLMLALFGVLSLETAVLGACAAHWFPAYDWSPQDLLASVGFQWAVTLPTVMLMLVIASACKNMWVSLGIGVILVFTTTVFPQGSLILQLCPFSTPYQMLAAVQSAGKVPLFLGVCAAETVVFGLCELVYLKVRRRFA